jgi:hypothetical protein
MSEALVVDAVSGEPVSSSNSLLSGKLTGKFAYFGQKASKHLKYLSVIPKTWWSFP